MIQLPLQGRTLSTYVASPVGSGPWPGVVVLHDVAGMNADVRRQADWLAEAGFVAAAPDLFEGGSLLRCLRSMVRDYLQWRGQMFEQIEAVRKWLGGQPSCSGSVGVIGFCIGGDFALLLAPGHHFGAASVNYGRIPDSAARFFVGACPIVASYGAKDRGLRGAAKRLEAALEAAGVPHDVKEYADAGHAFMNHHEPGEMPTMFLLLGRATHAAYDASSEHDARQRIVSFFRAHLT